MTEFERNRAGLEARLDADPEDWGARLVLADLLEELGDERGARCQRWMATWKAAPRRVGVSSWAWYGILAVRRPGEFPRGVQISQADLCAILSPEIFDLMVGYEIDEPRRKVWPSRRDAERALAIELHANSEM